MVPGLDSPTISTPSAGPRSSLACPLLLNSNLVCLVVEIECYGLCSTGIRVSECYPMKLSLRRRVEARGGYSAPYVLAIVAVNLISAHFLASGTEAETLGRVWVSDFCVEQSPLSHTKLIVVPHKSQTPKRGLNLPSRVTLNAQWDLRLESD
jgi:hypothetical protein